MLVHFGKRECSTIDHLRKYLDFVVAMGLNTRDEDERRRSVLLIAHIKSQIDAHNCIECKRS